MYTICTFLGTNISYGRGKSSSQLPGIRGYSYVPWRVYTYIYIYIYISKLHIYLYIYIYINTEIFVSLNKMHEGLCSFIEGDSGFLERLGF